MTSLGVSGCRIRGRGLGAGAPPRHGSHRRGGPGPAASGDPAGFWERLLRDNVRLFGGWLVRGLGGFVGLVGSAVILLSFVFYMLLTRSEWIDRLIRMFS